MTYLNYIQKELIRKHIITKKIIKKSKRLKQELFKDGETN